MVATLPSQSETAVSLNVLYPVTLVMVSGVSFHVAVTAACLSSDRWRPAMFESVTNRFGGEQKPSVAQE
jgi:hypothetical protein